MNALNPFHYGRLGLETFEMKDRFSINKENYSDVSSIFFTLECKNHHSRIKEMELATLS